MKRSPILAVVAVCALLLSCKNKNTSGLSIPKDASFVFYINPSSLASKLPWSEIKSSGWFQEAYKKADDKDAQKLMDNPEASGIDLRKDMAFFVQRRGRGGIGCFEGSIKDPAAFEALCKKLSKVATIEKNGDWSMLTTDTRSVVAWNANNFVVINDMPLSAMNPMPGERMNAPLSFSVDSLKAIVKDVMATSSSNSLFDDDHFASLVKEDGDMHMWMNSGSLVAGANNMMSMMKVGDLLAGAVTAATLNFDDGKISVKAKSYFGKEMQDLLKKWNNKNIDASVLNRIPSDNVVGVMAANIDPQYLKEFFKAAGLDGFINAALSKQNLTMDELLAATKGELILAVSDVSMQNQTITIPSEGDAPAQSFTAPKPDFTVMVATNVNQKPTFDKLLSTFTSQEQPLPFAYKLNNDWFVASNKPATVDGFLAGNSAKKSFTDKISGHPFGMYIDFQRLLNTKVTEEPGVKGMMSESAAMWKDLVATGGEFKDGSATSEMVVNLVDSKTNSLKQLNQYFEKMYQASKKSKLTMDADPQQQDTITVAPPAAASPQ